MGLRGPVPSGGRRAVGDRNDEPKAPRGTPKEVRAFFRVIVKGNPHLTAGDTLMILQYAQALVIQLKAFEEMLAEGIWIHDTTHGDGTEKRRHPNVITWRTAAEQARQAAMRLGVTPLDRMRVVAEEPDDMGSLAEMLFEHVADNAG